MIRSLALTFCLISCHTLDPSWTHVESPTAIGRLAHSACGSIDEKFISFGGIEEGAESFFNNKLAIYDLAKKSWEIATNDNGPSPRNSFSFLVADASVVIFGGETDHKPAAADAWSYDFSKASWQTHPDATELMPRKQATLSLVGATVILFGGKGPEMPLDWGVFDLKTRRWHRQAALTGMDPRVSHVAVPLNETELLIWGGFVGPQGRGDGFILNPTTNAITPIPPTPLLSARANARAVRIGHEVFLWGGATEDGNANSGAVLDLISRQWTRLPPIPDERFNRLKGAEIVFLKKVGLLLIGGRFGSEAFNEQLWIFDLGTRQWIQQKTENGMPGRIAHCVSSLSPRKIAVFGGIGYQSGTTSLAHHDGLWLLEFPE